jgi:hypothetical protein
MKCGIAVLALALLMGGLAGCATPPHAAKAAAPATALPASFDFILVSATNAAPDSQAEAMQLQDAIVAGLRDSGLFANVDMNPPKELENGGIRISATIKQITRVSKSARIWYGGLAGKARVVVQAALTDLATGKPLETFEVEGHTGASSWAGITDEAIHLAAAQVVDEMKRLNAQAAKNALDHDRLF